MPLRHLSAAIVAVTSALAVGPALASTFDTTAMNLPGILGYYPFTPASQANSTVNGYTGVLENGATIGGPGSGPPVSDPNSSALELQNGGSGTAYAIAGGSNPLQGGISNAGSIIAWINLASLPSTYGRIYSIAGESQVGNDFDLQINGDNRINFYTDSGSSTATAPLTSSNLNTWLFVAATFTAGGDRDIYLDGQLAGTSIAGGHSANSSPFYQGESPVFTGRYFDGALSDVGVYDTALTADEVDALYASSSIPTSMSTVPLPASAPMFGTALITLGAVGYGLKRKGKAVA